MTNEQRIRNNISTTEKLAEIEKMQAVDPDGARRELRKLFAESDMQMPGGMRELNYEYVDTVYDCINVFVCSALPMCKAFLFTSVRR